MFVIKISIKSAKCRQQQTNIADSDAQTHIQLLNIKSDDDKTKRRDRKRGEETKNSAKVGFTSLRFI